MGQRIIFDFQNKIPTIVINCGYYLEMGIYFFCSRKIPSRKLNHPICYTRNQLFVNTKLYSHLHVRLITQLLIK